MASTQATIDLVVRGSGAVNRLIQDVNQLQSAVDKINSRTLDVATKTLNSNVREIEAKLKNIGTASDPRPEIAKRATELTKQQTRATREYEAAVNRQSRALEGAVRAEQTLAERRQRRTRTDSNAERQVVEGLNKNIAAYRTAENEVGQLLGRFRSIGRQFAEIQRASAEIRVPTLGQLINANEVAATQRSIRALAQEFNRLGDSAQIGADETRARTDLSNQRVQFDRLADQLVQTRVRAQALREELAAIGRNERLIGPLSPNIAAVIGEGFNTDVIRSLMEAKKAEPQNEQIRERNQAKQRRRAEIRTQLRDDITLINQLETEAVQAGDAVVKTQKSLANIVDFRYRNDVTGNKTSLNKIQAQAESLALVANNSNIASNDFRQYTVAAEVASIKLARAQQNTFTALAAGFSGGGGIQAPKGLRAPEMIAGARNLVGQVLTEMPTVATGASSAALSAYINMLRNLQALVPMLSVEFRALEEGIARTNEELRNAQLDIANAPSTRLGSLEAVTQQEKFRQREEKVAQKRIQDGGKLREKQIDLQDQIDRSKFSVAEKDQLRLKLEEAFVRLGNDQLESATGLTNEIGKQIKAKEALLRAKPVQVFGIEGQQFSPVTGKSKTGEIYPGSPAAQEQIAKEQNKAFEERLKNEQAALKDLIKYTEQAERNAQKLQASYDRLDLTQAIDEYLAGLSSVEKAADKVLKSTATVPETGADAGKDFLNRLEDAVQRRKMPDKQSTQLLALEKLQKRLVEVEIDGVNVAENKAKIEKLISDIKSGQIPATKQSVDLIQKELQDARLRLGISQSQAKIDGKIADVLKGAVGGPSKKINDLAAQQKYAVEINDVYQKTEDLLTRIGKAAIPESQKLALSASVDQARNELYEQRLESAQFITKEVEKQLKLETALQATASKKDWTRNSWQIALARGEEIRQEMKGEGAAESGKAFNQIVAQERALAELQLKYNIEEGKGVKFLDEKVRLRKLLNDLAGGEVDFTLDNSRAIGENIKLFRDLLRIRTLEAKAAGEYQGSGQGSGSKKPATAEQLEARRERLLNLARGGLSQLIDLENKGVVVSNERLQVEQAINNIQAIRNKASERELQTLASQVVAARNYADAMRTQLKTGGIPGVGLQAALQSLQEARQSRQQFLGTMNPAEGIDKIVREFNTGKPAAGEAAGNIIETFASGLKKGATSSAAAAKAFATAATQAINKAFGIKSPSRFMIELVENLVSTYISEMQKSYPRIQAATEKAFGQLTPERTVKKLTATNRGFSFIDTPSAGYRPLPIRSFDSSGAGGEMDEMFRRFRSQIAALTTQPSIYRNLLNALPSSRITTDLVGAANRRARVSEELPSFMPTQRMLGPGELEKAITNAFSKFIRELRVPASERIRAERFTGPKLLAPAVEIITPSQQERITRAYERSAKRGLSVLAEDAFRGAGRPGLLASRPIAGALPPALFASGLSPAQELRRLRAYQRSDERGAAVMSERQLTLPSSLFASGLSPAQELRRMRAYQRSEERAASVMGESASRQLALPAGRVVDAAVSAAQGGLRNAISGLFDRISNAISGVFGGGGGPRPPVGGGPGSGPYRDPDDLARRAAEAAQQGPQALLGLKELANPAKVSAKELEALSAILKEFRSVLDPTIEGFDRLDNQLRETAANLDRQLERRAPDADFLTRRFDPRIGRGISEGLIGGAFPLLFGQGLGASVGGLAGGFGGGFLGGGLGFGLSLIGTALGAAFDALNQAAQETGKSLNYPIEGFESLKAAGLFASRQQEYYISKLIETGQTARATAEIQAEMIKKIGVSGVNDLMELGDASLRLSKAWAEFNLQLQAALAGPMAGLLEWVASIVDISNQSSRSQQLAKDVSAGLTGNQKEAFDREIRNIDLSEQIGIKFGPLFGGLSKKEAARQRTALAEFYKPSANMPRAREGALTPEQQLANLDKAIEKADKARSLVQQGIALERSNVDLRLSIEDTVYSLRKRATDMEREAIEFRRSVEDQVFSKRQELEQKLIENDRKRQQNAIEAFDLQLQKASIGLDPVAQGVVNAAREYLKIRAEGEADLQQAEKQLKLELQRIDQEVNRYKLQVEDRVSQMAIQRDEFSRDVSRARLQIERQIGDYVIQIEEHRLAMAKHRYEVEIDLERKKQIVAQEGLAVQAKGGYTGTSVDGFPIGDRPGERRHPITGQMRMHTGVDIPAPIGTALGYEIGGKVLKVGTLGGYGKILEVELDNGVRAFAAHLNEVLVKAGDKFGSNQLLARVGSTGLSTGPHVHIEGAKGGDPYAPLPFLQLGKAVSGKADPDIYLQPGVGYFSRKTGRMVRGLTGGAGQAASAGASVQAASGAVGAKPIAPRPPSMPALPSSPQLIGINDLMQQYLGIIEKIRAATAGATAIDRQRLAVQSEAARFALEQQVLAPILQYKEQNRELEFEIQKRKERNRLAFEGIAPELIEGEIRVLEIVRDKNSVLAGLETTTNQAVRAELERLKLNPELVDGTFRLTEATLAGLIATTEDVAKQEELRKKLQDILDLRNKLAEKAEGEASGAASGARGAAEASILSPREKVESRIGELKKELADLADPANRAIAAADAIGRAFSDSFKGVISGSMSAQEALASFFQSTADHFLDMAAQMIAKMITMAILNKILGVLPGFSGGGVFKGGYFDPITGKGAAGPNFGFANGGVFAQNGIAAFAKGDMFADPITPFAMGGAFANSIVKSPTLFKFADGGAMRTGLMGEAGPEAVMPLTRGPGGRLGVDASGGGGDINVTVNVDAKGTSVEGDQQQGAALGQAISAAVQAEIIKQKRPGGILA